MDQRKLPCVCGQEFDEEQFVKHFSTCQDFKSKFREFDQKFGELLKSYSEPKERLLIVKFLLKQYISVIDKKLKKYFDSLNSQNPKIFSNNNNPYSGGAPPPLKNPNNFQNEPISQNNVSMNNPYQNSNNFNNQNNNFNNQNNNFNNQNPYSQNNQMQNPYSQSQNDNPYSQPQNNNQNNSNFNNLNNQNNNKNNYFDDFNSQPMQEEEVLTNCQRCKINPDINYLSCLHPICLKCFKEYAEKSFYDMKCNICDKAIDEETKKMILGKEKYSELENKALMGIVGNVIRCPYPGCGELNAFEPGKVDYNVLDENNKKLSRQAAEDYAQHRCRCGNCKKDYCISCNAMPYHLGKTCEEFKHHIAAKKCRFCDSEIKNNNKGPCDDVCNQKDCIERYRISCKKVLPCGHKCFGVCTETLCPPCLDSECPKFGGKFDQDKDSYCNICFTEGLGSAPIVELSCGHLVHYMCIKKRLETRWIGPKITFNHCLCPQCNNWYECKNVPELQKMVIENKKLYSEISEMAIKRLKFEDLDKDPRLTDPNSPWYNKKLEFAMKRLSYYMCYVCKKPYFAGRRECGNAPGMDNDDPNKNYDPKDCICGKDANLSGIAGVTNCPKHGKDYIEYKCKFCCKIASWFCWGTTHFCEDCHKRQCNNDYVSKIPKDKLPKCNKATCEVGGNHPPNGEEYALGCSICRNSEENQKDF